MPAPAHTAPALAPTHSHPRPVATRCTSTQASRRAPPHTATQLLSSSCTFIHNPAEDLTDNAIVKFCRRTIRASDHYDGDKFWTTLADGSRVATPLLLTLAVIELSDVIFAVDSIPAVFGVTLDPFIIYTSNIFGILSLRSLYTFVSSVMTELKYLDKAVALVLGFIGAKMLLGFAEVDVPTDVSLLVVGLVLGGGVAASLLAPEPAEAD